MNGWNVCAVLALLASAVPAADAKVDVVTSTETLAWVARAVGGNLATVQALARGDRDLHTVEARPSQVVTLARADMLVRVGMDLDMWMDPLLDAARNAKVGRGGKGYVDASVGLDALEVPSGKVDPSMGDIHIFGNPHYEFDPVAVRDVIALNVLRGFLRVDAANSATYRSNYETLKGEITDHLTRWQSALKPYRGRQIVTYHKTFPYLLARFGLKELGNVEPKPGIAPSAGHVAEVARQMKQAGVRVILTESFRNRRFSDLLARQSGGAVVIVPGGVGAPGAGDYFSMMETIVSRLAGALG
jgi:zinc/manganese transport system substrate-binding protein